MQPKNLNISKRLWLAITLVFYSLASYFIERTYGGDWANWNHALCAALVVWYLTLFYKSRREVMLTGFFQIYYSVGMLLSASLVSGGMYMFEIAEFGNQNGIFWVLLAYFVAGLETSVLGYRLGGFSFFKVGVQKLSERTGNILIFFITMATLLICVYVFINFRGPVLLGIDRVTFWREYVPSYLLFVPTLVVQSFFFVAYYFLWAGRSGQESILPTLILVAYVLVGIFILGQKLSLFMLFITVWFALLPGVFPNFIIKRSHMFALMGAIAFLVISVFVTYTLQDKEAGFALARIALQAQVLWSVFDDPQAHNYWPADWSCYFGCGRFFDGSDFISYKYLPSDVYRYYSEGGTTLSGFMPALSIITMGHVVSIIIHIMISFILGVLQRKFVLEVAKKNIIYSFLLYKTHFSLTLVWFAAMSTAIPGLIVVLILIGVYRCCFPILSVKKASSSVCGVLCT